MPPVVVDKLFFAGWAELEWDYAKILIIVVVIEAAFPVSNWMIELMHILFPSSTGKKKKIEEQKA